MIIGLAVPNPLTTDDGSLSSPPLHRSAPGVRREDAGKWTGALPGMPAAAGAIASATWLRCGGCHASGLFRQDERGYGVFVHAFLSRHERCGNAVAITRVTGSR